MRNTAWPSGAYTRFAERAPPHVVFIISTPPAASVESVVAGLANVFIFLRTQHQQHHLQGSAVFGACGQHRPDVAGLRKPVNDLFRGASVDDIAYTIALTAIQASQTDATPALQAAE